MLLTFIFELETHLLCYHKNFHNIIAYLNLNLFSGTHLCKEKLTKKLKHLNLALDTVFKKQNELLEFVKISRI